MSIEIINKIHAKYGYNAMREIWVEELMELALALQHNSRGKITRHDVISEIADVAFIIDQMFEIFGHEKCQEIKDFKIKRTAERLL